jgi:anti-anti-sigma regulatory factor
MEAVLEPHIVTLAGAQTIREAVPTHAALLEALRQPADVLLNCTDVTDIDLSFIQIILAARRTAGESGRRLGLTQPPGGALADALKRGGFLNESDPALWGGTSL